MNIQRIEVIIACLLAVVCFLAVWRLNEPQAKDYNKYMCANYGYAEDCKTPLAPEERLK